MASSSYFLRLIERTEGSMETKKGNILEIIASLKDVDVASLTTAVPNTDTEEPGYTTDVTELDADWWEKNYKNIEGCTKKGDTYTFKINGQTYTYNPKTQIFTYKNGKKTQKVNIDLYVAGKNVTDLSGITTTLTSIGGDGSKNDDTAYTKGKAIKEGTLVCWINWKGTGYGKSDYKADNAKSQMGISNATKFCEGIVKLSGGSDTHNIITGWSSGGQQAYLALSYANKGDNHLYDEIIACNTSPTGWGRMNFSCFKGVKVHICETVGDTTNGGHDFTGDYLKNVTVKINGKKTKMTALEAIRYYGGDVDIYTSSAPMKKNSSIYKLRQKASSLGIDFNVVPNTDNYNRHKFGAAFGVRTGLFK